jgi:apolipoprotein N-acyltransferase
MMFYWLEPVLTGYGGMPLPFSILSMLLLFSVLSLFYSIPLYYYKERYIYLFPFFYLSFEILLEYFFTGFPWGIIADSQGANIGINYLFNLFGVRGITLLILFFNILFYKTLKERNQKRFAIVLIFLFIINIPGYFIKSEIGKKIKIGIVQGNEKMETDWTADRIYKEFKKYYDYTKQCVDEGAKIIVWPEFNFPYYPRYNNSISTILENYTKKYNIVLILGANDTRNGEYYNTAFVFNRGKLDYYYKNHLTPFGEYIPYKKIFFFANKIANVEGEFTAGIKIKTFEYERIRFGIPICYEMVFPSLISRFYKEGIDLIITITNDSWYGNTSGPHQHFHISKVRAMEAKLPVVRAATSGISGFISSSGKTEKTLAYNKEGYLISNIKIPKKSFSLFYEYFYLFEIIGLLFGALYLFLAFLKDKIFKRGGK